MTVQLLSERSVAFGFAAWAAVVTAVYIWPKIQTRSRIDALRTLLILHAFRFIGLSFLVAGVVSPNLPLAGDGSRRDRRNSPANDWIDAIDPILGVRLALS
jgi:hypothetical protein